MLLTRAVLRDTCTLRILYIHMDTLHHARIVSHSGTTNMRLARAMRARCAFDRLKPHAYGHGALAGGECAVMAHVCRPPVRTVVADGGGVL